MFAPILPQQIRHHLRDIFGRWYQMRELLHIQIDVAVTKKPQDLVRNKVIDPPEGHDKARNRIRLSRDRYLQYVIVAVPEWMVALAK